MTYDLAMYNAILYSSDSCEERPNKMLIYNLAKLESFEKANDILTIYYSACSFAYFMKYGKSYTILLNKQTSFRKIIREFINLQDMITDCFGNVEPLFHEKTIENFSYFKKLKEVKYYGKL